MTENPYLPELHANLPRLLSMFDADCTSRSYGMGDRYYWAWGLIDFGNGTFQGAAHGMARLWRHGLWPYDTPTEQFISRIDSLFNATANLTRKDGSLEEAFPNEGSYCVTALVAFDLLSAHDLLRPEIGEQMDSRWQAIVAPMIDYLKKADETHAMISNHLATAVAALARWHSLTQAFDAELRARQLLDRILLNQSEEGWFKEYEGADPGYQSLCIYYLADVHKIRPDWQLLEPLRRSIQFLWHFAHPDGSFGGLYGSRCTRFYYPAGVLALASEIPEAMVLADFMAQSIQHKRVVTLSAIDEPNFAPTFNSYCWAAALMADNNSLFSSVDAGNLENNLTLPALDASLMRKHFPQAGLLINRGMQHYTIVSTHKGGVVYHFVAGKAKIQNAGIVVRHAGGALGSSQSYSTSNKTNLHGDTLEIRAAITPMPKQLPSPLQFIALRILCVSLFRFAALREWVKQQLVRMLITGAKPWPAWNTRVIQLGEKLTFTDEPSLPSGYAQCSDVKTFVPIHMASQGYWQVQDEEELV